MSGKTNFLVDIHAHLDQYDSQEVPSILSRAQSSGIGLIVTAGTTVETSQACVRLAHNHPMVYAGVGLHPMDLTGKVNDETWSYLRQLAMAEPKVIAISEVGLDFAPSCPPQQLQETVFRSEIQMAQELRLPIIFHTRDATTETLRILREEHASDTGGVWHYFIGSTHQANEATDMGFYISIPPPILHMPQLQKVVSTLPLNNLVLESDSFPQTWKRNRENWNEPKAVQAVAQKVADLLKISLQEVQTITTNNALKILNMKE
jgi:TatD DNase family protein